jgi:hypothetical protein
MIQTKETVHNIGDGITVRPIVNDGTNTIATDLKRVAFSKNVMRAFRKRAVAFKIFSTGFNNVALEGTDEMAVPYYPLTTDASADFDPATGYTFGDTSTSSVTVTINKRKYQSLSFSSAEKARQPNLNPELLASLKGEKLALDVWADVLSAVTLANFGAAVKTQAASAYTSNDLADLKTVADKAQWPEAGRGLVVSSDIDNQLLKDDSFKITFAFGSSSAIQEGQLVRVSGFDYVSNPNIPSNSENLIGFLAHKAAIAVGFSPIKPTLEVARLASYELITDEETGLTLEYRRWGSADFDSTREVIECNYGYQIANTAALKRLTSA